MGFEAAQAGWNGSVAAAGGFPISEHRASRYRDLRDVRDLRQTRIGDAGFNMDHVRALAAE
jgi:hypothetical protein